VVTQADVRGFAKEHGLSIEMAARRLRHEFLARTAIAHGIYSVAMAHHLDDQLELFFLRLLRGSGSQGLSGMKWSNPSPNNRRVTLVRPLLECTKQRLREYAAETRVRFREDASNRSLDFQRNRIRHELLPLLKRHYQRSLTDCLLRAMDILGAESQFITATADSWLRGMNSLAGREDGPSDGRKRAHQGHVFAQSAAKASPVDFASLPIAIQRRCIQLQLTRLGVQPDFELIEHLRNRPKFPIAISRDRTDTSEIGEQRARSQKTTTEDSIRLVSKNGRIAVVRQAKAGGFQTGSTGLDLRKKGQLQFDGVRLAWQVREMAGLKLPTRTDGREAFDADKVGPEVIVRHWRAGDRFQPIGMRRSAKLQDLFVNQKVPREQRRHLLVATTANGELFWTEGFRISERFKLTKGTIRRLQWRWQRL
jgi:tRNA(Ile)-lysidine synthase